MDRQRGSSDPAPSAYARLVDAALRYLSLVVGLLATLKELISSLLRGSSSSPKFLAASVRTLSPDASLAPPLPAQSRPRNGTMQLCTLTASPADSRFADGQGDFSGESSAESADECLSDAASWPECSREPNVSPSYPLADALAVSVYQLGGGFAASAGGISWPHSRLCGLKRRTNDVQRRFAGRSKRSPISDDVLEPGRMTNSNSERDACTNTIVAAVGLVACPRWCTKSIDRRHSLRSQCRHVPLMSATLFTAERASDAQLTDDCLAVSPSGRQWSELVCGLVGTNGIFSSPVRQHSRVPPFVSPDAAYLQRLFSLHSEPILALTWPKPLHRVNELSPDAVDEDTDWRPSRLLRESLDDVRWQLVSSALTSLLRRRDTVVVPGRATDLGTMRPTEPPLARFASDFLAAAATSTGTAAGDDHDRCHDVDRSPPPQRMLSAVGLRLYRGCSDGATDFAERSAIMWSYVVSAENSPAEAVELLFGHHHQHHHSTYHRTHSLPLEGHRCRGSAEGERTAHTCLSSAAASTAFSSAASASGSSSLRSPLHRLPSCSATPVGSGVTEQGRSSNSRDRCIRSAATSMCSQNAALAVSSGSLRLHQLRTAPAPAAELPSGRRCHQPVTSHSVSVETSANTREHNRTHELERSAGTGSGASADASSATAIAISATGVVSTAERSCSFKPSWLAESSGLDGCVRVQQAAGSAALCDGEETAVDSPADAVCAAGTVSSTRSSPSCSHRPSSAAAPTPLNGTAPQEHGCSETSKLATVLLPGTKDDNDLSVRVAVLPEPDLVLSGTACRPRPEPDVVPHSDTLRLQTAAVELLLQTTQLELPVDDRSTVATLGEQEGDVSTVPSECSRSCRLPIDCSRGTESERSPTEVSYSAATRATELESQCTCKPTCSQEDSDNDAFEASKPSSGVPVRWQDTVGKHPVWEPQSPQQEQQRLSSQTDDRKRSEPPTNGNVAALDSRITSSIERRCEAGGRELRRRSSARECVAHGSDVIDASHAATKVATTAAIDSVEAGCVGQHCTGAVSTDLPADCDHRPLIRQAGQAGNSSTFPPTAAAAGGRRRSLRSIFSTSSVLSVLSRLRRPPNQAPSATRSSEPLTASASTAPIAGGSYQGSLDRNTSFASSDGSRVASASWSPRHDPCATSGVSQPGGVGSRFSALLKSRSFSDLRGRARKNGLPSSAAAVDGEDRGPDPTSPRREAAAGLLDKRRGKCKSLVLERPVRTAAAAGRTEVADDEGTTTSSRTKNAKNVSEEQDVSFNGDGSRSACAVLPIAEVAVPSSAPPTAAASTRRLPVNSHLLRSNRHSMPPLLPQSLSWHDLRAGDGDAGGSNGGRPSVEQARRERSRRLAALTADELLLTERDYVAALRYVVEEYAAPEADASYDDDSDDSRCDHRPSSASSPPRCPRSPRDDVSDAEHTATASDSSSRIVFGNIAEICSFHSHRLLPDLESCIDVDPFGVGACFLRHREEFLAYSAYIRNKPRSDALMQSLGMKLFKRKQTQLADPLDLSSYLLKPIQRLGKYALILRRLHKECVSADDGDSPAEDGRRRRDELAEAEEMVRFCLRHGNDLLALDALCDRQGSAISTGLSSGVMSAAARLLLRQDELLVTQGGRSCRRRVFLFEHLLLFSKPRLLESGIEKYTFKLCLKMCNIGLTETVGSAGTQFEVWLHKRKKGGSSWILQAPSADVKQSWVKDISELLWNQAKQRRDQQVLRSPLKCVSLTDVTAAKGAAQIELVTSVSTDYGVTRTVSKGLKHSAPAAQDARKIEPVAAVQLNAGDPGVIRYRTSESAAAAGGVREDDSGAIQLSVSKSALSALCERVERVSERERGNTPSYRSSSSSNGGSIGSSSSSRASTDTLATALVAASVGAE